MRTGWCLSLNLPVIPYTLDPRLPHWAQSKLLTSGSGDLEEGHQLASVPPAVS